MRPVVDASLLDVDDLVREQDRRHPVGHDEDRGARAGLHAVASRLLDRWIHGRRASSRISNCGLRISALAKAIRGVDRRRGWRLARPRGCRAAPPDVRRRPPLGHLEGAPPRRHRGRRRG